MPCRRCEDTAFFSSRRGMNTKENNLSRFIQKALSSSTYRQSRHPLQCPHRHLLQLPRAVPSQQARLQAHLPRRRPTQAPKKSPSAEKNLPASVLAWELPAQLLPSDWHIGFFADDARSQPQKVSRLPSLQRHTIQPQTIRKHSKYRVTATQITPTFHPITRPPRQSLKRCRQSLSPYHRPSYRPSLICDKVLIYGLTLSCSLNKPLKCCIVYDSAYWEFGFTRHFWLVERNACI